MRQVWKYVIEPSITISMPVGAKILHVDSQRDEICMWVLLDVCQNEKENRHFSAYGTGHMIEGENHEYIGSALILNDSLVFHVFEVFHG